MALRPSQLAPRLTQLDMRPSLCCSFIRDSPNSLGGPPKWIQGPPQLALRPSQLALRPSPLALKSSRLIVTTDGLTDGWMENLPILQDFIP